MLFLHGSQGLPRPLPFLEALCSTFHVIAPEHPGFGLSDRPRWLASIRDLSLFYLDLLEARDLRGVHVVGQAIGGWVALEAAICSTERIASLVVVGAPGIRAGSVRPIDVFSMSETEILGRLFHSKEITIKLAAQLQTEEPSCTSLSDKNKRTLARLARRPFFHSPHLRKWLHRVRIPTLILWGAEDRAVPREIGEAYHSLIPNSKMMLLEGCGHLPHIERPDEYVDALIKFIDEGILPQAQRVAP
ncbi:pimeloyl-ACP methyl ester carboxylesterase [Bradyrhizobium sp. USDA 4463]